MTRLLVTLDGQAYEVELDAGGGAAPDDRNVACKCFIPSKLRHPKTCPPIIYNLLPRGRRDCLVAPHFGAIHEVDLI